MRDESFWEMEQDGGIETAVAEHKWKCRCLQRHQEETSRLAPTET